MLLQLFDWLAKDMGIRAFNVFSYVTLRTVLAAMTALTISFVLGPWMIRKLTSLKIGQSVRGDAWKRRPLGRRPKLTPTHKLKLEQALLQGAQAHGFLNDLWTLPRVAELIHRQTQVRLHPGHVWRVLGRMGWSIQRPAGKAVQRDEAAIARWKKHTWPALKKSP